MTTCAWLCLPSQVFSTVPFVSLWLPVRGCVSHHSILTVPFVSLQTTCAWLCLPSLRYSQQFHLFLWDYLCVAVSPITRILNSSICFFMTTCVWLCLPSLYSVQFHLFLYDYLCVAVSPITLFSTVPFVSLQTTCAWLCLPSLDSQQFHLFLYDYLCVAVSPVTLFCTVPFVSLWLPVRGCVSHHSILNSSICFFMTTCAWLCLPSLYSVQFHLFLYDYLCVAVSPITRFCTVPFVSLWLPVRGCVSHHTILNSSICFFMTTCAWLCLPSLRYSQQFHLFLYDYLCVAVSPITLFSTVPFVSLWLPVMAVSQPRTGIHNSSICFFETTCAWLWLSHAQVVINSSICFFMTTCAWLWLSHAQVVINSSICFFETTCAWLCLPSLYSNSSICFFETTCVWLWHSHAQVSLKYSSICFFETTCAWLWRHSHAQVVIQFHLFLYRLPVRGCVSHHSILNSSICFFTDYLCVAVTQPRTGSHQQFHLFLWDYLCVAVSPITLFSTVPFVSLWLPVCGCVSHHSILYSSICFFMTTCAWLCLPSLYSYSSKCFCWWLPVCGCVSATHRYSQQFHLFLYDYLCVAVSQPSHRYSSTVPFVSLWLPVRGCDSATHSSHQQFHLFLYDYLCVAVTQPRTGSLKETNVSVDEYLSDGWVTATHR